MSRLRRDRRAMKWARYTRRNETLAGHPGDVRETKGAWAALGWLIRRKARWRPMVSGGTFPVGMRHVMNFFYN